MLDWAGPADWGYADNDDNLINVESINVNIDDCGMRRKSGYETEVIKKQKRTYQVLSRKFGGWEVVD